MKKLTATLALSLLLSTAAQAHYVHHPKVTVLPGSSGGALPWIAGGLIGGILGAIIWHEINGPKCAKAGLANGYDTPALWRPLCNRW